jgi:hypothetical protein
VKPTYELYLHAKEVLWRHGDISHKLRPHQKDILARFNAFKGDRFVVNMPRQSGKTYCLSVLAIGSAIAKKTRILYATYSLKATKGILQPAFAEILSDCPEDIRPRLNVSEGQYHFPNGSIITLAGLDDGRAENYRGRTADLVIVDEAGFIADLGYVVKSVLFPMTKTTRGRTIIASTPPPTPAHDFVALTREAALDDGYVHKTVYDDSSATPEDIEGLIRNAGGKDSIHFRREFLGEFVVDEERAVIPEFQAHKDAIIREAPKTEYFLPVVSMDVGYRDNTAVLYGFYEFKSATLVVEAETYLRGATTDTIAKAIRAKEAELWGNRKVHTRWSDTDPRLIADLHVLHGLDFAATQKDEKEAQINQLRIWVKQHRIAIAPDCKRLISDLLVSIWNKQRTDYERTSEGHADGIDALVYMLRNAPVHENPYPAIPEGVKRSTHFIPAEMERPKDTLASALLRRKTR